MKYIQRNIDSNYTQMNNHSAQNAELSLQAKGLLWVLMTNKDDWRPYIEELSKPTHLSKTYRLQIAIGIIGLVGLKKSYQQKLWITELQLTDFT